MGRISDAFPSNARRPRCSLLKPPARARSARARLQAGAGARMFSQPSPGLSQKAPKKTHEKLTAVPRGALPLFFSPLFVLVSSSSPSLAMLAALAFHALPVPSIARFRFLGVFCNPLNFLKNATPSMRKPCFFDLRGVSKSSQNGSQNASKIKLRCGGPPGEPRGAILGGFWRAQEAPQRLPRAPRERQPRRVKMSSRRPQMTLRRPQMTPRRGKMSPRRAGGSSGRSREASGSDWGGFPRHF